MYKTQPCSIWTSALPLKYCQKAGGWPLTEMLFVLGFFMPDSSKSDLAEEARHACPPPIWPICACLISARPPDFLQNLRLRMHSSGMRTTHSSIHPGGSPSGNIPLTRSRPPRTRHPPEQTPWDQAPPRSKPPWEQTPPCGQNHKRL